MNIHGLNKLTLLDFPGRMACLIFTGACNYRCPFCHNASLVINPDSQPVISKEDIFAFLKTRTGILEGVCISGGEPTLQPDLEEFIREIRRLGFLVKLDTNGSRPEIIKSLLSQGLLDYVAMDIKNCIEKYLFTTGLQKSSAEKTNRENLITAAVRQSASILMESGIPYEFRTTVVREYHTEEDLLSIGNWLNGAKAYYLQSFRDSGNLVGAKEEQLHAYTPQEMRHFCELLQPYFETVDVRGAD